MHRSISTAAALAILGMTPSVAAEVPYFRSVTPAYTVPQAGSGGAPSAGENNGPSTPTPVPNQPVAVTLSRPVGAQKARVGDAYAVQGSAPGLSSTPKWTADVTGGALPSGIQFDATNAAMMGTVLGAGAADYALSVVDSVNHLAGSSGTVSLQAAPALSLTGLPGPYIGRVGDRITTPSPSVPGLQGTPSFGLSVTPPAGVPVTAAGGLDGVATAAFARSSVTMRVSDAWDGRIAYASFELGVYPALTLPTPADYATTTGVNYTQAANAGGVLGTARYDMLVGGTVNNTGLSACGMTFSNTTGAISTTSATLCDVPGVALRLADTVAAPNASLSTTKTTGTFRVSVTEAVSPPASGQKPDSIVLGSGGDALVSLYNHNNNESGSLISGLYAWDATANFAAGVSADCTVLAGGTNGYAQGTTTLKVTFYNGSVSLGTYNSSVTPNGQNIQRLGTTPAKVTRVVATDLVNGNHTISEFRVGNWNGTACLTP